MLVDIGEVKRHVKPKADSTLHNMRKADLIDYIRCLEHNYNVAVSFNENQARYIESLGVTVQQWISVTERLPKRGEFVLFSYEKGNRNPTMYAKNTMAVGRYDHKMFLVEGCAVKVTHWMPLPEPPKEEPHEV